MFSASPKHSYTKSLVLCVLACFLLTTLLLNATLTSILPGPFKLQPEKSYRKIILHVTKELKTIASIGGVGSVVAGLSQAQSKVYTDYDIWVVMPYYSFISQRTSQLFSVSVNHDGKQVTADLSYMKHDGVHIVFVGPGDKAPFDLLWQSSQTELYTTLYPLTFTHRDMFFSAAVFDLITYFQSTGELEIVHIHGSTNGMLPGMIAANFAPNQRPVTIYTLHDYVYEPDILLEPSITLEFPLAAQVVKSDQDLFYPCYHALKWADTITAVSDGMVQGILADEIPFLFRKIMLERFFYDDLVGIPNSIEPYLNPFKNQFLIDNGLAFSNHEPLLTTKQKAKDVLYPDILPSDSYPLVLFIGRLDVVKGVDTFENMAKLSRQLKFQFIVVGSCTLGQRANWDRIKSVILKYENVRVVDSPQDQQQYGLILRMAADFVFVPSKMESFGLVAVEACKYGAIPIVNNVPGLRTAINNYYKDNSPEKNEWTGFVFDKKSKPLERVMESALNELEGLKSEETEALLRRLINSHLDWEEGWETGQNSVAKYLNTYTTAAEKKNCINCTTQHNETDNLVANGSFDSDDVSKWWPYFDGYTSNFYDITMANVPCKDEYVYMGATQRIDLDHLNPKMALVSGWSRVDYVVLKHNDPSLYSLFVDVYYKDNSTRYGENAPFSIKPHTWEYKEIYLYFEKPVDFITVTCRFVSSCGIAYFDDISVVVK